METYTIAAAARLVGTAKGKLYQAARTGRLQATRGPELGDVLTVTAAALQAAGFIVPSTTPAPPSALPPAPALLEAPTTIPAAPAAAAVLESQPEPPPHSGPEQALIAHLEQALEAAQAREHRLLDLLAQLTRPPSVPPVPAVPEALPVAPVLAAAARAAAPPPMGSLRQQIVAVLQAHPEGLAPHTVRALLQVDRDVRSTMKGMVRSGVLRRLEAGRYVVAGAGADA
jgi:hypothetical protein